MGERTAIQFVGPDGKSVWCYFHYRADFTAVSEAIAYIQSRPKPAPYDGRANSADHIVVGFIVAMEPERVFDSTTDYGNGEGMDWGAWQVDTQTGHATAIGKGAWGVQKMTEPGQWDADEMKLRPARGIKEGSS